MLHQQLLVFVLNITVDTNKFHGYIIGKHATEQNHESHLNTNFTLSFFIFEVPPHQLGVPAELLLVPLHAVLVVAELPVRIVLKLWAAVSVLTLLPTLHNSISHIDTGLFQNMTR